MTSNLDPAALTRRSHEHSFYRRVEVLGHTFDSIARSTGDLRTPAQLMMQLSRSIGVVTDGLATEFVFVPRAGRPPLGWCYLPSRGRPVMVPENPLGFLTVHDNCFLCLKNILVQNPSEPVYPWTQEGAVRQYYVLPQIRAFAPNNDTHLVLASAAHEPQAWSNAEQLVETATEMVRLAKALPGFTLGFNGDGAAASNPGHLHYQALECGVLPLLSQAMDVTRSQGSPALILEYPVAAIAFRGTVAETSAQIGRSLPKLFACGDTGTILAQVLDQTVTVVYVPRAKTKEKVRGPLDCRAGFLEIGGVLLLKRESDRQVVTTASDPYALLWDALASLEPDGARDSLKRLGEQGFLHSR